jgi:hypothetical protein
VSDMIVRGMGAAAQGCLAGAELAASLLVSQGVHKGQYRCSTFPWVFVQDMHLVCSCIH